MVVSDGPRDNDPNHALRRLGRDTRLGGNWCGFLDGIVFDRNRRGDGRLKTTSSRPANFKSHVSATWRRDNHTLLKSSILEISSPLLRAESSSRCSVSKKNPLTQQSTGLSRLPKAAMSRSFSLVVMQSTRMFPMTVPHD